tara:strand:+ start:1275 stop:1478 length:204 start_codon:yes stop_codon:yes gene_type:complete
MDDKNDRILGLAMEIVESGEEGAGVCHACVSEAHGVNGYVEPDAEKYRCEHCGKRAVFGADSTLFMF